MSTSRSFLAGLMEMARQQRLIARHSRPDALAIPGFQMLDHALGMGACVPMHPAFRTHHSFDRPEEISVEEGHPLVEVTRNRNRIEAWK